METTPSNDAAGSVGRRRVPERADELATRRVALAVFVRRPSPQVLMVATVSAVVVRVLLGRWHVADVAVATVAVAIVGPVEWLVHRHVLHAGADGRLARTLGTGSDHRRHHLDPPAVEWILLGGPESAIAVAVTWVATAAAVAPIALASGVPVAPLVASGVCATTLALLRYEWVHLLLHTRCPMRSRRARRRLRNHRLHHYRNEEYWLGVTSSGGDRLFGTLPAAAHAVEASPTARTLGVEPVELGS